MGASYRPLYFFVFVWYNIKKSLHMFKVKRNIDSFLVKHNHKQYVICMIFTTEDVMC